MVNLDGDGLDHILTQLIARMPARCLVVTMVRRPAPRGGDGSGAGVDLEIWLRAPDPYGVPPERPSLCFEFETEAAALAYLARRFPASRLIKADAATVALGAERGVIGLWVWV